MKVIAKFTDGSSYTWKGVCVDGRVEWDKPHTYLWEDVEYENFCKKKYTIEHLPDLLCIIQKDKGCTTIYTNPKYDNIHIGIERGKKRSSYVKVSRNVYNNLVDRITITHTKVLQGIFDKYADDLEKIYPERSLGLLIKIWRKLWK